MTKPKKFQVGDEVYCFDLTCFSDDTDPELKVRKGELIDIKKTVGKFFIEYKSYSKENITVGFCPSTQVRSDFQIFRTFKEAKEALEEYTREEPEDPKKTCKNCVHYKSPISEVDNFDGSKLRWATGEKYDDREIANELSNLKTDVKQDRGICIYEKICYDRCDNKNYPLDDKLEYYDYEQYSAGFYVGRNFGCIHFKKK